MTRDEASQKLIKELGWTRTQADLFVNGSACLAVLKLDEPKSAEQIFWDRLESCGNNLRAPIWDEVRESLHGFEIVEK